MIKKLHERIILNVYLNDFTELFENNNGMLLPYKYSNTVNWSFQNENYTHPSNNGVSGKKENQHLQSKKLKLLAVCNREKKKASVWSGNSQLQISSSLVSFLIDR